MLTQNTFYTAIATVSFLTYHLAEGLHEHHESNIFVPKTKGDDSGNSIFDGNIRLDANTFTPVAVYDPGYELKGKTPQELAHDFLSYYTAVLRLDIDTSSSNLQLSTHRQTSVWTNLRFNQVVNGVPVLGSHVIVTIDQNNKVKMITSSYTRGVNIDTGKMTATMRIEDVRNVIMSNKYQGKDESLRVFNVEQVIFPKKKEPSVMAWKVVYAKKNTVNEFMAVIEDSTEEILQDLDVTLDKRGRESDVEGQNARILATNEKRKGNSARGERNNNEVIKNGTLRANKYNAGENAFPAGDFFERITKANPLETVLSFLVKILQAILSFVENPSYMPTKAPPSAVSPAPSPSGGTLQPTERGTTSSPTQDSFIVPTPSPTRDISTGSPSKSSAPTSGLVGNVFDPDPISSGGGTYGSGGFTDNNDQDSSELTAQLVTVNLRDLRFSEKKYHLIGPYAQIVDFGSPSTGLFAQESNDFRFTRNQQGFEAVNCYYHIDNIMRYINNDLGIEISPYQYEGGVKFDPHGADGADNSFYSSGSGHVEMGEGGVDDGEDPDVIIHELGHGLHDWLTDGGLSQVNGLSEGFGDYLATSYSRSKELYSSSDNEYNWVFKWDGHNEYWNGRVVNSDSHYPEGLVGQVHTDGQIWSACNMKIWEFLGREKSDKAHFVGLSSTGSNSNQEDVAKAILLAANSLGFKKDETDGMLNIYAACGYTVSNDVCGDGVLGASEECEGNDIGDAECSATGCSAGKPICNKDTCKIDYSSCGAGPGQVEFELVIKTDDYGAETRWDLKKKADNALVFSDGGFQSDTRYEVTKCIPGSSCYIFTIYDSAGDGLCCGYGEGNYRIKFDGEVISDTNGDFESYNQHELCSSS